MVFFYFVNLNLNRNRELYKIKTKTELIGLVNLFFGSVSIWFHGRFNFLGFFLTHLPRELGLIKATL